MPRVRRLRIHGLHKPCNVLMRPQLDLHAVIPWLSVNAFFSLCCHCDSHIYYYAEPVKLFWCVIPHHRFIERLGETSRLWLAVAQLKRAHIRRESSRMQTSFQIFSNKTSAIFSTSIRAVAPLKCVSPLTCAALR
jgi:hypothetical protein